MESSRGALIFNIHRAKSAWVRFRNFPFFRRLRCRLGGSVCSRWLCRCFFGHLALEGVNLGFVRRKDHAHAPARHARRCFNLAKVRQCFNDLAHARVASIAVHHLAPAELLHDLHLVALDQKLPRLIETNLHVMWVDLHRPAHANFLQFGSLRLRLVRLVLLGKLVLVLAKIQNATDRWRGVRRDLNKVKPGLVRSAQGFDGFDNADHLIVFINQTDRIRANALIDIGASVEVAFRSVKASAACDGTYLLGDLETDETHAERTPSRSPGSDGHTELVRTNGGGIQGHCVNPEPASN